MKKINSINYGGKIILIGIIPLVVIPFILFLVNKFWMSQIIEVIILFSVGIGTIIEIGFFIHLAIELHQDAIIDKYYSDNPDSELSPDEILRRKR